MHVHGNVFLPLTCARERVVRVMPAAWRICFASARRGGLQATPPCLVMYRVRNSACDSVSPAEIVDVS